MKFYFMGSLKFCAGAALWVLISSVAAGAEPERYEFPAFVSMENAVIAAGPLLTSTPLMPSLEDLSAEDLRNEAVRQDNLRREDAKKECIVTLLQQYNKKLDSGKASDYAAFIMKACEKFKQDPFVIAAVIVNESSARHDALSKGGDYGLMQVRWRVHQKKIQKKYPQIEDANHMFDPEYNVLVGTEIFSTYYASANQDVLGALMYYTAGNRRHAEKVFTVLSKLEKSYIENLKKGQES